MEGSEQTQPAPTATPVMPPDPEKQALGPDASKTAYGIDDWDNLDNKELACCGVCPCTYTSAVMSMIIVMAFNLVLFAIVPLASVHSGWIYWSTDEIFGGYYDYEINNGVTINIGWYKGSVDFLYNGTTSSLTNLLQANGTASVPQALGITCGSLAAVSLALSCVYLLLFIAMMMPLRRWCWTIIKAFPPFPRCAIALLLGAAIIALASAFLAEVDNYFEDRVDAIAQAHGREYYDGNATPWCNYAWVFFLFGGICWMFFGWLSVYIPTAPEPRRMPRKA